MLETNLKMPDLRM